MRGLGRLPRLPDDASLKAGGRGLTKFPDFPNYQIGKVEKEGRKFLD
jgi:hypothetical protein